MKRCIFVLSMTFFVVAVPGRKKQLRKASIDYILNRLPMKGPRGARGFDKSMISLMRFNCPHCDESFELTRMLDQHISLYHRMLGPKIMLRLPEGQVFQFDKTCPYDCGFKCQSQEDFAKHIAEHLKKFADDSENLSATQPINEKEVETKSKKSDRELCRDFLSELGDDTDLVAALIAAASLEDDTQSSSSERAI